MSLFASLPMYDWPEVREDTDKFWSALAVHIDECGIGAPAELTRSCDESKHWLHKDLLFSQTCGYPFATKLIDKVQLLGTPHYDVEGCDGPTYRSAVIVRNSANFSDLSDTKDARFAFNGSGSLSGYRCLVPLIGAPEAWFTSSIKSGGHRKSASMVAKGEVDIAAIDAVCWDLFRRFEPKLAGRLQVLTWTPALPSLPYITSLAFSSEEVDHLQEALARTIAQTKDLTSGSSVRLADLSFVNELDYAELASL